MEGSKVLQGVFFTLMCAILMALLYEIFFQVPIKKDGVTTKGVLQYSAMQVEHPISKYYYSYCFLPFAHMEDSVDASLGATIEEDYSSINSTESNLYSDTSDNVKFNNSMYNSMYHYYSTGWQ